MRMIVAGLTAVSILAAAFLAAAPRKAESYPSYIYSTLHSLINESLFTEPLPGSGFDDLAASFDGSELPVGRVQKHETENAWGYAVYIPQTHKNPASKTADKVNDAAEIAQNEIYALVKHMVEEKDIDFIMSEGDLYGEVPDKKIKRLSDAMKLREELSTRVGKLEKITQENASAKLIAAPALSKGKKALSFLGREISLAGAPYVIKAEGADIGLYGAENEKTREKCTHLVRDYVYQEDRIKSLKNSGPGTDIPAGANTVSLKQELLRKLLSRGKELPGGQNNGLIKGLSSDLFLYDKETPKAAAPKKLTGTDDVGELIDEIDEIYIEIEKLYAFSGNGSGNNPNRSDNPYNNIGSAEEMKKIHNKTEKDIKEIVIEQRNRETAENFASALKRENEQTGILQFGAGHEEGLVRELQKQGLSVLVVSPTEVEK